MKNISKLLALCLAVMMALSLLSACTGGGTVSPSVTPASTQPPAGTAAGEGTTTPAAGSETAAVDPFGKYPEPVTITSVKDLGQANLDFPEGDSLDNNVWTRYFEEHLNIVLEWAWSTNSQQYPQKVNIAITSDDIPDLMSVNGTQLKMMYENEQLMDMTDIFEQYAAPFTKEVLNSDGGDGLRASSFDGRLYAIPKVGSPLLSAKVLWVRTDWLESLNMELPKTAEDFMEVAEAFTTKDPDGNGVRDTFGLAVYKDMFGSGYASLEGFFNMYGAYPNIWVDKDGGLAYGSIQPEAKDALAALQDMYSKGYIDSEFGVKDANKVNEDVSAGRIGMMFGDFWNAAWINDAKVANPDFEWAPVAIPANGAASKAQLPFGTQEYYAVSAECEHPEAIVKLLNAQLEKNYGETAEPTVYNITPEGYGPYAYAPTSIEPPMKNFVAAQKVTKAIESGDTSELNDEELNYYELSMLSINGDHSNNNWHQLKMFGPNGSLTVMKKYWDEGNYVINGYYGAPTPTMTEKLSTLEKQQLTDYTKIILGGDIAGFDTFVDNWMNLGGQQITDEVNEWHSTR